MDYKKTNYITFLALVLICFSNMSGQVQNGSFKLINANTDTEILTITGDFTWDLATADSLNVVAVPIIGVTHVKFTLSNGHTKQEGVAPYAAYGDVSGDYGNVVGETTYFGWAPSVGDLDFTVDYLNSGTVTATDTFTITFVDSANDTQAPTVPTLVSTGQSQTTADLSWSGATDNIGVTGYKIFKDGSLEVTLGNVGSYQVTGLTAETSYSFSATALDAAGNESAISNTVSVTTDSSSGGGGGSSVWTESGSTASYSGDVAIGTSSVPTGYKLAVDGNIRTREIRVDQDVWPDYVFEVGYNLPSLQEIQEYISKNGHLPNIPSAKEVEINGVELGEMNKLLLEKIEELTLYILQQEKRIEQLEKTTNKKNR